MEMLREREQSNLSLRHDVGCSVDSFNCSNLRTVYFDFPHLHGIFFLLGHIVSKCYKTMKFSALLQPLLQ